MSSPCLCIVDSFTEYVAKRVDQQLAGAFGENGELCRTLVSQMLDEALNDDCEDPKEAADRVVKVLVCDTAIYAESLLHGCYQRLP